jgi:hypothetical protein
VHHAMTRSASWRRGISGIEILRDTSFGVSIRSATTYWISILWRQSWRSNWMVAGIIISCLDFAIGSVPTCLLIRGHCAAVLEPSSSLPTGQRLKSNLVRIGGTAFVATLCFAGSGTV